MSLSEYESDSMCSQSFKKIFTRPYTGRYATTCGFALFQVFAETISILKA